jgi:hypothetical protein
MTALTAAAQTHADGRSREAARLFSDLMAVGPAVRRGFLAGLTQRDLEQLLGVAAREGGTPYALWRDDPVGFTEDVLGESLWSKPREILGAIPAAKRIAVPSCFGSGKTWSSARAVLWMVYTRPPGTAKAVTIAPLWRQVIRQLWPEIRTAHSRAGLPGAVDMGQLKIPDAKGMDFVAAYGIAAAPWNEAAVQGVHAPSLLLVVDEAGGIGHVIGRNLRGMLVGEGTHMLAIGNPPTDEEGSWFEGLCSADDVKLIPIRAEDTPNLSGETAPHCHSCPAEVPAHSLATHLVDADWVTGTVRDHGEDSNYVAAKVHAIFPRGGVSRAIPSTWIDAAAEADEPDGDTLVALTELGLEGEREPWNVRLGSWVRLGIDVAADGGDEFVIARCVGDLVQIRHRSSGAANANPTDVAGIALAEIRRAEELAKALGTDAAVRVKVDGIGVGWGVVGILQAWASEGLHDSEIISVVVSEKTDREPESATLRPNKKRDEMWLAMRHLLRPRDDGSAGLRLRVDQRTLAQLRAPAMGTSANGNTVIEGKASMKTRGLPSPDRAEAVILACYEPAPSKRKRARLIL